MVTEHNVLRVSVRICPYGSKPSHKARNPIGRLDGLITMAFEVEQRLDEVPTPFELLSNLVYGGLFMRRLCGPR